MRTFQLIGRMIALWSIVAVLLVACGGAGAGNTAAPPAAEQPAPTTAAEAPTEAPAAAPTEAATEAPAEAVTEAPAEAATEAPAASGERLPIEIVMQAGQPLPAPAEDFVKQGLDEALNADVKLTTYAAADEYNTQLNVRMAAGNYPDLFSVSRATMVQFVEKGQLLDLTPYMDKLGPTTSFVGEETMKKGMFNDKVYAVAKTPQIPYNTYWVRKDWLAKVGMEAPTTIDQLYEVAVAFTEKDPDGNGAKDTYGITGGGVNAAAFAPIFGAFGVGTPGSMYVKDGKLINAYYDPAMKDALAFIQKMQAAGVVDPELAANTGLQHQQKAIQGQAGIIYIDWPNITKSEFQEQIKTVNPNAEWQQIAPPSGPGGQFDGTWDIGAAPTMFAVSRALEENPEKLQKVFELLNYVSSPEGSRLVQYGVEGKHFNLEGEKVVPTDLMAKEANYIWVYQFTGRPEKDYLFTKFAPQEEYIEFAAAQPRIESVAGFVVPPSGYNPADANRFTQEQLLAFIGGTRPLTEYDAFLQELETTFNYKAYMDAAQQQLTDLGVVEASS